MILQQLTQIFVLIAVIFTLILRLWGLDKGFDITDEGYALLGYQPLQERFEVISSFHTIVSKLFGWLSPDITTYRLIALIITIVSSFIFAFSFWTWLRNFYHRNYLIFDLKFTIIFMIFGGFVLDYTAHQNLSYNTLNNAHLLLQASLIFLTISQEKEKVIKSAKIKLAWLAIGFSLAFQFLVKPPSAIHFICLLVIVLFFYNRKPQLKYYLTIYGCLITGFLIGIVTYFSFFQNLDQYIELLSSNLSNNFDVNLSDSSNFLRPILPYLLLWKRFLSELKWLVHTSVSNKVFWFYLTVFLFFTIYTSTQFLKTKKNRYLFSILVFVFTTDAAYQLYRWGSSMIFEPKVRSYYLLVIAFLLIILTAVSWKNIGFQTFTLENDRFWQVLSVCIFLFFLPLTASIGTNDSALSKAAIHIEPWLALVMILLININKNGKTKAFVQLFILSFVFWLLLKMTYCYIYKPFRIAEPRLYQTETLSFAQPNIKSLKVDPKTKKYFEDLNSLIKKTDFKTGDPIIALYDMPGVVYILGGVSPGAPWYFGGPNKSLDRNCKNFMSSKVEKSRAILLTNNSLDPKILTCLKKSGINFPKNYRKLGEVLNSYFQVLYHQENVVAVWAPKNEYEN